MFNASSKPHLSVGRYPNPEYRGLTYSTFFGLLACTGMRLSEAINLRMQDITADGLVIRHTKFRKSRCFRSIRRHKLPWSVICRSDASLPHSTITCSLACENGSCFGTTPTLHFAELSRRSAFRVIRAFRGPRSMRCDTHLP